MSIKLKNRGIAAFTALLVALTIFAVLPAAGMADIYGATTKGTVKNGPVNVRSNAGIKYKKIGTLATGKIITIKGTKNDKSGQKWYKFTYKSKTGYVFAKYIKVKSSLGALKKYSPSKKGVMKQGPVNLRSNAGVSYKKIGSVKKKATVILLGERTGKDKAKWYWVKYGSKIGYVLAQYVIVKNTGTTVTTPAAPTGEPTVPTTTPTAPTEKPTTAPKPTAPTTTAPSETAVNKKGTVNDGPVNVRSGPGTGYSKIGSVAKGTSITVLAKSKNSAGETWYRFNYSSKKGYIRSDYVTLDSGDSSANDENFEQWMEEQGFLKSYKSKLRALHKAHPKWIFKTQKTGLKWSDVIEKETKLGINLVEPTSPDSWKSREKGAYDSKTDTYTKFDGRWNAASENIIAYYMDPRNFLNETSIFLFMDHFFDAASQNKSTIKSIVSRNNCYLNTSDYITYLYNAGKSSKVNPNVITAMAIVEQGWKGGSRLISGTYKGYEGYYNHLNVGAYASGSMTAVERGLWWAKGAGTGETSYGRPWNSIEKSLSGGASFYAKGYVDNDQYTYYTKKFNVMNGLNRVATHQYMTNVAGSESEGRIVKYAYEENSDYPVVFYIPIYSGMPSSASPKPQ